MKINVEDVLGADVIRDIAEDEVRRRIREELKTGNDVERFIGNIGATFRQQILDDIVVEIPDFREQLKEKIQGAIRKDINYDLFRPGDTVLRRKPTLGQWYLDELVKSKREVIEARATKLIETFGPDVIESALVDQLREVFRTNKEETE